MLLARRHVLKSLGLLFGAAPAVLVAQEPEPQTSNLERSLAEIMSALQTDLTRKWRQAVRDECLGDYQSLGITLLSEEEWDEGDRLGLFLPRRVLRLCTAEYHWDTCKLMDAQAKPVSPVVYTTLLASSAFVVSTRGSLAAITAAVPQLLQLMASDLYERAVLERATGTGCLRPIHVSDPVLSLSHVGHSGRFSFHVNVNGVRGDSAVACNSSLYDLYSRDSVLSITK